jgi:hypothetical protein
LQNGPSTHDDDYEDGPVFRAYTFLLFDLLMTDVVVTLGIAMA